MIIANFGKNETYKEIRGGLWQWDYGQVLRIQGLDLPTATEIHFSLRDKGGEAVTRVGTTKDGVTDAVIPDTMLENNGSAVDYFIYAFIYLTDAASGQTEYKISMKVKSRPKPEAFDSPEDAELFREAIAAVNEAADRAETAEKEAEGWAHGREDMPKKAEDNAKYYAGEAARDAEQTSADRKEVERLVESVAGIDEDVDLVRGYKEAAEKAAGNAATSAQASEESRKASETAKTAAETAQTKAEEAAGKTAEDRSTVEQAKTDVEGMKNQVTEDKTGVEQTVSDFELTAQQAVTAVNNAGQTQYERVQGAGNTAVQDIQTAKEQAVQSVETAGTEQVQAVQNEGTTQIGAVQQKGQEVLDSIPEDFSTQMDAKLDKNQGAENSGKVLVVGEDGTVTPGETPIKVDPTLTQSGQAADAKSTGDAITALAIKNQVSGEVPIIVTDSAGYPIQDLGMEGWTEQASTTGAQLLDVEFMKQVSSWIGTGVYGHLSVDLKPNTTYTMFVRQNNMHKGYNPEYDDDFAFYLGELENSASSNFMFGNTTSPNINVKQYTFTTTDKPYYINLFVKPWSEEKLAIAFDELLVDIMLVEGGSVVPYEPYTGNQPSPSPDYPQEIINAGKYNEETQKWEYEIKLQGKNLFDFSKVISSDMHMSVDYENQTITIPAHINNAGYVNTLRDVIPDAIVGMTCAINAKTSNPEASKNIYFLNAKKLIRFGANFEITNDLLNDYFSWYNNPNTNNENIISEIQVEYGDTPTAYEPYRLPQTVLLKSDRPLTKWDRLEKRDGQWGWVFKSAEIVLDGSENWGLYAAYNGFSAQKSDLPISRFREGFTERFRIIKNSGGIGENNVLRLGADNNFVYAMHILQFDDAAEDKGLQAWKDYLSEKPVTILTYADEETFVPLTEEEQSALNALHTNYPTTVLVNDQGCEMSLEYVADTKNYIDQKIQESIQQSIAGNLLSTNSNQSLSAPMGAALNLRLEALEAKTE